MSSAPLAPTTRFQSSEEEWVEVAAPSPTADFHPHAANPVAFPKALSTITGDDMPMPGVAESDARDYVSRLWAEDWNSPEDAAYDA